MSDVNDIVDQLSALHVLPQSVAGHHADTLTPRQIEKLYEVGAVAEKAIATIVRLTAELEQARASKDRLMIATAASVKASMDEYKRGHADGMDSGRGKGLEEAARIARSAQYSKSPAVDAMRGIEKLIDTNHNGQVISTGVKP